MKSPTRPHVTSMPWFSTDSPRGRGRRFIMPGVSWSKPSAMPKGALTMKWVQSTWPEVNGWPEDVEDARAHERDHERQEQKQDEADVLRQIVVELAALFDGVDDGREVVVGEDHPAGVLRHL